MIEFWTYLRLLLRSMTDKFAVLSLLVFLGALIAPSIEVVRTPLLTFSLVAAFFFAGYSCWKKERHGTSTLNTTVSEVKMRPGGHQRGGAILSARVSFRIDLRNASAEEYCSIERPEIARVELNTPLLGQAKRATFLSCSRPHNDPFPIRIPSKDLAAFTANVDFPISTNDPKDIANALGKLDWFSAELTFRYRFVGDEGVGVETKIIRGTYDSFRDSVISIWEKNENFELLYLARGENQTTNDVPG